MADVLPLEKHHAYEKSEEIIPLVDEWIGALGIKEAFKHAGTILLYSGPIDTISDKLKWKYPINHEKTYELINLLAKEKSHTLLDNTATGIKLDLYINNERGLYNHLKTIYRRKFARKGRAMC